jgi:hypothetical protein
MIGERTQALTVLSDGVLFNCLLTRADEVIEIEPLFAAVHESVVGTFRTWRDVRVESGKRRKADIMLA